MTSAGTLHPQAAAFLALREEAAVPPLPTLEPPAAREASAQVAKLLGPGPEVKAVDELAIEADDGATIPARRYTPADPSGVTVVYFHGGGWVVGGLNNIDAMCRKLANASRATIVSVSYRLAPEHRYPAAVQDAWAALRWVADELDSPGGLVVGGDSAGGTLAAVCALRARDRGGPTLKLQLLVYPATDADLSRPSYAEHGHSGHPLGVAEMAWFWDHYIPDQERRTEPEASPLRAASLAGLPPALIVAAGFDPLYDEVMAYAERLRAEGVEVELIDRGDMLHGFFVMVNYLEVADAVVDAVGARIASVASVASP